MRVGLVRSGGDGDAFWGKVFGSAIGVLSTGGDMGRFIEYNDEARERCDLRIEFTKR